MDLNKYYKELTAVQNDKSDSVEGLVNRNLKFALKQAYKFKHINSKIEFEDIISAANSGLIMAAQKYNPKFKNKFITYARFWIFKYIHDDCVYNSNTRTIGTKWGHQKKCNEYNRYKINTTLTNKEIQKKMNLTDRQFVNILKFNISTSEFSLNENNDEDEKTPIETYVNSIKLNDDNAESSDEILMKKEDDIERAKKMENIFKNLNSQDREIIKYHFFHNLKISQVAKKLKISPTKLKTKLKNILKNIKENELYEN